MEKTDWISSNRSTPPCYRLTQRAASGSHLSTCQVENRFVALAPPPAPSTHRATTLHKCAGAMNMFLIKFIYICVCKSHNACKQKGFRIRFSFCSNFCFYLRVVWIGLPDPTPQWIAWYMHLYSRSHIWIISVWNFLLKRCPPTTLHSPRKFRILSPIGKYMYFLASYPSFPADCLFFIVIGCHAISYRRLRRQHLPIYLFWLSASNCCSFCWQREVIEAMWRFALCPDNVLTPRRTQSIKPSLEIHKNLFQTSWENGFEIVVWCYLKVWYAILF